MHQDSARETLKEHEVTIVDSFEAATKKLTKYGRCSELVKSGMKWEEAEIYVKKPVYDTVLTDMNLPMDKESLAPEVFNSTEQVPYGFVLALLAAAHGAKYIAMLTDTNHHQGAMSAAIDCIAPAYYVWYSAENREKPKVFHINNAVAIFVHTPFFEDKFPDSDCDRCKDGLCEFCNGTLTKYNDYESRNEPCWCTREDKKHLVGKCSQCHGTLKYTKEVRMRKDWGRVLNDLMQYTSK